MDYIKEMNAFYDLDMANQLTPNAISLYFALLNIANKLYWKAGFTVSNLTLQSRSGIADRKTLDRARNQLIQKGLIEYKPSGKVNQAGSYTVIGCLGQIGGKNATQNATQDGTQNGTQDGTLCVPQNDPINKQNKTNQNKTYNNNIPPINPPKKKPDKKLYGEFVELTEEEYARLLADYGEQDLAWMIQRLDIYLGQNEKNRKKYTSHNHVLRGWVSDRLKEEKEKQSKVAQFKPRTNNHRKEEPEFDWGYGYKPD
jgi:hypothetical protein